MSYLQLKIDPRDLLFCRDAKPMDGSWIGHGSNWPNGRTFFGAILTALQHYYKVEPGTQKLFDSLRTIGPFPEKDGEVYFPTPLDILPGDKSTHKPVILCPKEITGACNLPVPLSKVLWSSAEPTKDEVAGWISSSMLNDYINGNLQEAPEDPELYAEEKRPGVTINPQTRSAKKGDFYTAEYLRLSPDVALAGFLRLNDEKKLKECFGQRQVNFQLGGQQCTVFSSCRREPYKLPELPQQIGKFVKWVLLTPAGWDHGWLPGFIDPKSGKIQLKSGDSKRQDGETRENWRKRINELPAIDARLVAARVGKAVPVSGWQMGGEKCDSGPRPTRLLVPAGSVFYFETSSPEESRKLITALSRHCHSDFGGQYGYGLGVCASYKEN